MSSRPTAGTRCAAITGGYVALRLALAKLLDAGDLERDPLTGSIAAVSCGMVDGDALLDLDYSEDSRAEVDANVVMSGDGGLVEVQATAERTPVSRASLDDLLVLAEAAIALLRDAQDEAVNGPPADGAGASRGRHPQPGQAARAAARSSTSLELLPLPDEVELPPEEGETFADNALAKARAAHDATGMAAIADDSGIEARALGGRPGVRSARYAGPQASDEENLGLLLRELAEAADRAVVYVCALAYVGEDGAERLFEGRCEGELAREPRGSGGFGYDPAFVPDDTGPGDPRTMAELSRRREALDQPPRAGGAETGELAGGGVVIRTKAGAATLSIVSNSLLIALKIAAGAITGSIAIITEAVHSRSTWSPRWSRWSRCERRTSRPTPSTPTVTRRPRTSLPRSRAC